MTVWLPQVTVSVSPATAPVPVRPDHHRRAVRGLAGVDAAAAILHDRGDRRRRRRRRVDRHRGGRSSSALALPAASVSLAVTSNVPLPCAVIVAAGTVTVALLAEMSAARSV